MGLNAVVGRPKEELTLDPIRFADMRIGCYDPRERAKDMLADGIYASILFPTLPRFAGTLFIEFNDKALADLCVRAYNDFVIDEWCPAGPAGMFVPTIIVQLWDPELAAQEIYRCAALGARALSFPENTVPLGLPSYFTDHWDPVWRACEETGMVLCLHIGTSGEIPKPSPEAFEMLGFALLQVGSIMSSVNLMMSPVCRKFPKIQGNRVAPQRDRARRPHVASTRLLQPPRRHPAVGDLPTQHVSVHDRRAGLSHLSRPHRRRPHHVGVRLPAHRHDLARQSGRHREHLLAGEGTPE